MYLKLRCRRIKEKKEMGKGANLVEVGTEKVVVQALVQEAFLTIERPLLTVSLEFCYCTFCFCFCFFPLSFVLIFILQ